MTATETLKALDDFHHWFDDQRRRLIEKGATVEELNDFSDKGDVVNLLVQSYLANGQSNIECVKVETLKSKHNLFKVVRVRAAFKGYTGTGVKSRDSRGQSDLLSLLEPTPLDELGDRRDYESFAAFIFGEADAERHVIETLPCTNPTILHHFQQSGNTTFYSVTGILLPNAVSNEYELLPLDLKPLSTPLDLIEPTAAEIESAEGLIKDAQGESLLALFHEMACKELGILDTGDPTYKEATEVPFLQAASHGLLGNESARIHSAIFGPPGGGKSKIAKLDEAIEPVCKRVEPQALTEDGLYGNTGTSNGRRIVRAGYVPQAHHGVFVVEDFHQANQLKNRRLTTTFSYVMETGRCEAVNASRTSYQAEVAFHLDANRLSDVDARKRSKSTGLALVTEDTGLPKNVLTRFDYISEFLRDPKRQLELSLRIAREPVHETPKSAESPILRAIKVALALLRTRIPTVTIDKEVAAYLEQRFRSIINVRLEVLFAHPDYSDFMSRGPKSFKKFVIAHARLCNRNYATKADVDATFPYVLRKFETVLNWIVGESNDDGDQSARKEGRLTLIRIRFRGKTVTTAEVKKHLVAVSEKTVGRYLEEICGTRNPDGSWTVPLMHTS